jgi:large subunit ribosomal protein L18
MENYVIKRRRLRVKRAQRVRKALIGTEHRPRLAICKSNQHIYAQIIDDDQMKTLVALGTRSKELRGTPFARKSKESAREIGKRIAMIAKKRGIERLVLDRGPFKYHGILAELADAVRAGGLQL